MYLLPHQIIKTGDLLISGTSWAICFMSGHFNSPSPTSLMCWTKQWSPGSSLFPTVHSPPRGLEGSFTKVKSAHVTPLLQTLQRLPFAWRLTSTFSLWPKGPAKSGPSCESYPTCLCSSLASHSPLLSLLLTPSLFPSGAFTFCLCLGCSAVKIWQGWHFLIHVSPLTSLLREAFSDHVSILSSITLLFGS